MRFYEGLTGSGKVFVVVAFFAGGGAIVAIAAGATGKWAVAVFFGVVAAFCGFMARLAWKRLGQKRMPKKPPCWHGPLPPRREF